MDRGAIVDTYSRRPFVIQEGGTDKFNGKPTTSWRLNQGRLAHREGNKVITSAQVLPQLSYSFIFDAEVP